MKKIVLICFIVFLGTFLETRAAEPPSIAAELIGFTSMYQGVPVSGSVRFTIENGRFAQTIFPGDFALISNLPAGFSAEPATRISDTVVQIRISGTPLAPALPIILRPPTSIPARNIYGVRPQNVIVTGSLVFGQVHVSASLTPLSATFDLDPAGGLHQDILIHLNTNNRAFVRLEYGTHILNSTDFTRGTGFYANIFRLNRSFLSLLPVGEWEIRFVMSQGGNPVFTINVKDSRIVTPPPVEIGPAPTIPFMPPHPDEAFIFLSGARPVDSLRLNFVNGIARVEPVSQEGVATMNIRVHALDNLAWQNQGTRLEVRTSFVAVRLPIDIMENIRNGREAMEHLRPNEVYFRLTLIDRSNEPVILNTVRGVHPNAQVIGNAVDIRAELVDANTREVFFTVSEFNIHNEIILRYMPRGFYTRPSAVHLRGPRANVEFVPHYTSQNTVSIRSLLPGLHALVHNGGYFNLTNLPPNHIGFPYAYRAATMGIVTSSGNVLGITAPMTRAEFVHLVALAVQLPTHHPATLEFPDVPASAWFANSVMRARGAMLLWQYDYLPFRPNDPITREEMLSMAAAALVWKSTAFDTEGIELSLAFADAASISPNYRAGVQIALNNGLVIDRYLNPLGTATRMEAIMVIIRLIDALE